MLRRMQNTERFVYNVLYYYYYYYCMLGLPCLSCVEYACVCSVPPSRRDGERLKVCVKFVRFPAAGFLSVHIHTNPAPHLAVLKLSGVCQHCRRGFDGGGQHEGHCTRDVRFFTQSTSLTSKFILYLCVYHFIHSILYSLNTITLTDIHLVHFPTTLLL